MLHLNESNFDSEVKNYEVIVIDFWAPWCGPCRALGPIIEQLAEEVPQGVAIAKVNIDECPDLATRFQIQSIPTLIFMKGGVEMKRSVGVATKADILASVNSL